MDDTFAPLAAELRANRGSRIRTNSDIHYLVRRMVEQIRLRLHAAGTDLTKLGALHTDLKNHEVDYAEGISGVSALDMRVDRTQPGQPGDIVREDPLARRVDGTVVHGPYTDQYRPLNEGGAIGRDGTPNQDRSPVPSPQDPDRTPDGALRNPARNPDGTSRHPVPGPGPAPIFQPGAEPQPS